MKSSWKHTGHEENTETAHILQKSLHVAKQVFQWISIHLIFNSYMTIVTKDVF